MLKFGAPLYHFILPLWRFMKTEKEKALHVTLFFFKKWLYLGRIWMIISHNKVKICHLRKRQLDPEMEEIRPLIPTPLHCHCQLAFNPSSVLSVGEEHLSSFRRCFCATEDLLLSHVPCFRIFVHALPSSSLFMLLLALQNRQVELPDLKEKIESPAWRDGHEACIFHYLSYVWALVSLTSLGFLWILFFHGGS